MFWNVDDRRRIGRGERVANIPHAWLVFYSIDKNNQLFVILSRSDPPAQIAGMNRFKRIQGELAMAEIGLREGRERLRNTPWR